MEIELEGERKKEADVFERNFSFGFDFGFPAVGKWS